MYDRFENHLNKIRAKAFKEAERKLLKAQDSEFQMKFDKNDDSKDDDSKDDDSKDDDSKDDDSKDDDSDDDDTNLDTKDTDNFDVTTTLASTMTTGFLEMQFTSDVSDGPPGLSKKLSQHNMGILAGDKSHRKIDIRYENLGLKVISNGKVVR